MSFFLAALLAATQAVSGLAQLDLKALDGQPFATPSLAGKAVLFVNVASRCGYTTQYAGLQQLFAQHKDKGLVVVGVPCNQFGGQEPGTAEEIKTFCSTRYSVEFPLLAKQDVNGAKRSALYSWLIGSSAGAGQDIGWNFEKFVVDRQGQVVARFPSSTRPDSPELAAAIERALAAPTKAP
jgi:glutathione peroxidase